VRLAVRESRQGQPSLTFPLDAEREMKNKNVQVVILTILGMAFSVWGLTALVRQRDTRSISAQLSAAVAQIEKGPQGVDGAEAFLAALKRIDPGHAPEEVKLALRGYILAAEQNLQEWRSGHPTAQVDDNMARAQAKLVRSFEKDQ
jgi:hypothetical protein